MGEGIAQGKGSSGVGVENIGRPALHGPPVDYTRCQDIACTMLAPLALAVAPNQTNCGVSRLEPLQDDGSKTCWPVGRQSRYYVTEWGMIEGGEEAMMSEIFSRGPIGCGMDARADGSSAGGGGRCLLFRVWFFRTFCLMRVKPVTPSFLSV